MRLPIVSSQVVAATPAQVLDAMRHAGEWRESEIPWELRRRGFISLESRVGRDAFRLVFISGRRGEPLLLHGVVQPRGAGSLLRVTVRRSRVFYLLAALGVLMLLAGPLIGQEVVALGKLWLVAMTGVVIWRFFRWPADGELQVQFLHGQLDRALATIPRNGAAATK